MLSQQKYSVFQPKLRKILNKITSAYTPPRRAAQLMNKILKTQTHSLETFRTRKTKTENLLPGKMTTSSKLLKKKDSEEPYKINTNYNSPMTVTTWKTLASNNNSPLPEKTVLPESNTLCGEKHAYSAMAMETYCITARSRDEQRHAGKIDSKKDESSLRVLPYKIRP